MTGTCDDLHRIYEAAQEEVNVELQDIGDLDDQRDALLQQGNATDADISELEAMISEIKAEIETLTAQQAQDRTARLAEITDALAVIAARLLEIDMLLQGAAPDVPTPGAEQVSELFWEADMLARRSQALLDEQVLLTGGVGDPQSRQSQIDAKFVERDSTTTLLQEATDLRADISADLVATRARRDELETVVNDAKRRAATARQDYETCTFGELEQGDPTEGDPGEVDPTEGDPAPDTGTAP